MVLNITYIKQNWITISLWSFFLFAFVYFSNLIINVIPSEKFWEIFPDTNDYINQSKSDFFSLDFFSPKPRKWFSPRPFTIPLLFKVVQSSPSGFLVLQRVLYCVSVLLFILAFSLNIENCFLKWVTQICLLYFFTWWEIVGWAENVLSEFTSSTFLFLWLSILIWHIKKPNWWLFVLLILVSFFFSFTRDTWPYIILSSSVLLVVFAVINKRKNIKWDVAFLFFSLVLFFTQNITSNIGERHKLPVFNSIIGRVSKNTEYMEWFKKNGMPLTDIVKKDFSEVEVDSDIGRPIVYKKYEDSLYLKLFNWIAHDGKKVYQKFVLTHPDYFLLNDQTSDQKQRIFCQGLFKQGYYRPPVDFFEEQNRFPFFNNWYAVSASFLIFMLFFFRKKEIYIFPFLLLVLLIINIFLSYNADTLEVERHLYLTQITIELIGLLSTLLLFQNLFKKIL